MNLTDKLFPNPKDSPTIRDSLTVCEPGRPEAGKRYSTGSPTSAR